MKYKVTVIMLCIAILAVSFLAGYAKIEKKQVYHQHQEEPAASETSYSTEFDGFTSHLPIVSITTEETIPGRPIKDENHRTVAYVTTESGKSDAAGFIDIMYNGSACNSTSDLPDLSSRMNIHIRGNSSRSFEKPGYSIELLKEDGSENSKKVIGMAKHSKWVLHGPYLDKTLIRNYLAYGIAGEIMSYAPDVRFCEVFINREYQGLYLMTERITNGKSGRLPLETEKKGNTFSGYLLRLDRGSNIEEQNHDMFSVYNYLTESKMNIEYPGTSRLTPEVKSAIHKDFSTFEKTLYSFDLSDSKYGYKALIDVNSFVDYFIINEAFCNYDAGFYSTYIYKGVDGKFNMCVWDFNNAFDNYMEKPTDPHHFEMNKRLWFEALISDKDFNRAVIHRYEKLRKTILSDENLEEYINSTIEYLGPAIERNNRRWACAYSEEYDRLIPAERNLRSYEMSVTQLKSFLYERLSWMDENIYSLKQYCAGSKTKGNRETD